MKQFYIILISLFAVNLANAQPPVITSFSPATGAVGTLLTICGTNFSNPTSFTVGGTEGIMISSTDTILVGLVMPGTTTGKISITAANGTTTSASDFTLTITLFPSVQQGGKLVGTGAIGMSQQGSSVSISADGNTAIVGGIGDNDIGAAWIFNRTGDTWTQQGEKLVGTGAAGTYITQGFSVSISANGNTAAVGGPQDNNNVGAVWIFTRTGNTWTQQGDKLLGTGAIGVAEFGMSVSLSADGNTLIAGGPVDNNRLGAIWIFTRAGDIWTQQGEKLVGTGAGGIFSDQGCSVSISANGNTAVVGGCRDEDIGAVWVFTRTGNMWTQQGEKLVGAGTAFSSSFGYAVSVSADGNTAIVGGPYDNNQMGAVWIFTRTGDTWTQQGNKLTGTGAVGNYIHQGYSVSVSADGNTAIFGGPDANNVGASWVFTRTDTVWTQQGGILFGTGAVGPYISQGYSVSVSADGNTAVIGGDRDNMLIGAAWLFTSYINTSVTSDFEEKYMVIYPNPTNDKIILESEYFLQDAEISIFTLQGKLLLNKQLQSSKAIIDISEFPEGIYFIKVSTPKKKFVKRFVKR
jgi:hypothetical protein